MGGNVTGGPVHKQRPWPHKPMVRSYVEMRQEAETFYQATAGRWMGTLDEPVLGILAKVHQAQVHTAFDVAVRDVFQSHGKSVRGALDALNQEYEAKNYLAPFNRTRMKRAMDIFYHGQDRHRGTAWEYRKEGFLKVPAGILNTLRQSPWTAGPALAVLMTLGFLFPTLSAMAGATVILYSLGAFVAHELKATRLAGATNQQDKAKWAEALIASGEDVSCIAMTSPGAKGIWKTLSQAFRQGQAAFGLTAGGTVAKMSAGMKYGLSYEGNWGWLMEKLPFGWSQSIAGAPKPDLLAHLPGAGHHQSVSAWQKLLVLVGLMDEIMLPFARMSAAKHRAGQSE